MKRLSTLLVLVLVSCNSKESEPAKELSEEPAGAVEDCRAEILCETRTVRPGTQASVGVLFTLAPHHHVYWKNPGDSGLAPSVTWTLPEGWSAGPIEWPAPRRFVVEGIVMYVYEEQVLLPVRLSVPAGAAPGEALVSAHVEWLVCSAEACVPGEAVCEIRVVVKSAAPEPDSRRAAAFEKSRAEMPKPLPRGAAKLDTSGGELALLFDVSGAEVAAYLQSPEKELMALVEGLESSPTEVEFFPLESLMIDETVPVVVASASNGRVRIELKPAPRHTEPVERIRGVLVVRTLSGFLAYEVDASKP